MTSAFNRRVLYNMLHITVAATRFMKSTEHAEVYARRRTSYYLLKMYTVAVYIMFTTTLSLFYYERCIIICVDYIIIIYSRFLINI